MPYPKPNSEQPAPTPLPEPESPPATEYNHFTGESRPVTPSKEPTDMTTEPTPPAEEKRKFRWTLFPRLKEPTEKQKEKIKDKRTGLDHFEWVRDWADALWLFPLCLLGFLTASHWIRKLDPTAQVLNPETLTVVNFNLVMLFLSSGVIYILFKIWVGGEIFPKGWDRNFTEEDKTKYRLWFLAGLTLFVGWMITRNV